MNIITKQMFLLRQLALIDQEYQRNKYSSAGTTGITQGDLKNKLAINTYNSSNTMSGWN